VATQANSDGRPAAFLDRDGTLMRDIHYPRDPEAVVLVPGAAEALRRLERAGIVRVVVTNQSGIAQGKVSVADYEAVRDRLAELLASEGASVDASYHCPHHPDFTGACDCRKPATGMYRQAAAELALDPAASLFVGDRWRDVGPGLELGGFALLVPSEATPAADVDRARREAQVVPTLGEAVDRYLAWLARPAPR
jgi:D-glycero-D-manno-heptose 1,7-bisphosphate phosphatase